MESKVNNHSSSRRLSFLTCECGYEILILPDLKAMNEAIKKHVSEHKNKGAKAAEANRIEDELIAQLFKKFAKSEI